MTPHLELLRFNFKPSVLRLAWAALADAGPVSRQVWIARAGLPGNHFAAVLAEAQRLQVLALETPPEGLRLLVRPADFWQERPMMSAEDFALCWSGATREQRRMSLATEEPNLDGALALLSAVRSGPESGRGAARNPGEDSRITGSLTSRRNNVLEIKRSTSKRSGAPESGVTSGEGLRERVRLFVGERDWRRFWEHDEWQSIFDDGPRAKVLASSLRYLQAGIADGVAIRKTPGSALWSDYKRELAKVLVRA